MFAEAAWGLDIGAAGVRFVRLARKRRGFEITAVDRIDTYRDPEESSPEELDLALRKALSIFLVNHRVRFGERVGVAIPGLAFETALLDLPPVAEGKVSELVDYEARSRFGARGDLCSGYTLLSGASVNERRVLLGVGPTGVLGGYLDALTSVGLDVDSVVLSPLALTDALKIDGFDPREAIVVRAGVALTDFILGTREGPVARTEPGGTLWIARTLRDRFGLGVKEADGERRAMEAREGNPRFEPVAREYTDQLAARTEAVLTWHRQSHAGWTPHRILLAGEGARIPGAQESLQERLGVPVETHSKWNRVAIGKHLFGKSLVNELPSFSVALGAAAGALGESWNAFSIVKPNRSRRTQRTAPAVALSTVAFVAGIAVASQWLSMASETSTETAKLVRDVRDRIANRHDLREMRELSYRRERAASKAFRLGAEWSAWERATSEVLDALGSEVVVLKCSWRRSPDGRRVYAYPVVGVPIPPLAAESAPAGFLDALKRQVQDLGLREPKVLDRRSVDVLSAEAPVSSAPTTDLYWLELEVPFEPGGAVK